jgi:receptor expression-enhancing protein 5/6
MSGLPLNAEAFEKWCAEIDSKYKDNALVKQATDATKQRPEYVILGGAGLVSFLIVSFLGMELLSNLAALLPLWASIQAVKSKTSSDDTQWLVYWIVFGVLTTLESLAKTLFFPSDDEAGAKFKSGLFLYYVGKIAFLYWCGSSQFLGAKKVYEKFILPVADKVDNIISKKA